MDDLWNWKIIIPTTLTKTNFFEIFFPTKTFSRICFLENFFLQILFQKNLFLQKYFLEKYIF